MHKRLIPIFLSPLPLSRHRPDGCSTGTAFVKPGDNLVLENIPPDPRLHRRTDRALRRLALCLALQLESCQARDAHRHPLRRHPPGPPGQDAGRRTRAAHLLPRPRSGAQFEPVTGASFVFSKDIGGGEWYQLYRYDMATGDITLLTDGKSRNSDSLFEHKGSRIAYTSTRRNGQDTDLYTMDIHQPKTDHMLVQLKGGGWEPD